MPNDHADTRTKHTAHKDHMGDVYDDFAQAFGEADRLPTWRHVGKSAMERLLGPHLHPSTTFLDLGSASGRVEAGVLVPGGVAPSNVTGIEISPDQVEMAKTRIPGARFVVGDISDAHLVASLGLFDVAFSHMVFEHLSDEQFAQVCANVYTSLKPEGVYAFVVTHPDKMTDLNGNLVTGYGEFTTTAPWGGALHNWRRSVEQTVGAMRQAGFEVTFVEELPFPTEPPEGLSTSDLLEFQKSAEHYRKYPAIRLAVKATKRPF
ncbi:MAG: class I SAM-dependent methyltransferase [bacterium]